MILFPAIDLKGGNCVRLMKGQVSELTIYNDNPTDQAREFANNGCTWLHVVDLDGAFDGKSQNSHSIMDILSEVKIPVQLGGGIRNLNSIENWLSKGVERIVLGTVAVEKPLLVKEAVKDFPDQVAVGIDARNGFVATHGWVSDSKISIQDLALRFEDCGVSAIIYTDIERDGIKSGPNIQATCSLANSIDIPVIASGGVSSVSDLIHLKDSCEILEGVIVGRALYDGSMTINEALVALNGSSEVY